ncbi:MAG TPA: riboflavin synthase [Dehalococcoidia bacterium]|nr:riboflavin synthase [Dehalococcoidia bacterium]
MFTGIIEEVGVVEEASPGLLVISARQTLEGLRTGDSIAVNGVCLTAIEIGPQSFAVGLMPETIRRTSLGPLKPGDRVNLERSLAADGRFGGHIVQGHVEATGTVATLTPDGDAVIVRYLAPPEIMRYVVRKGFIAVDGASLTVVDRAEDSFTVSLVGYTQENTNLTSRQPGDTVNLETDVVARYVEQFLVLGQPEA